MAKSKLALIDLDAMLHIVSYVQVSSGNRDCSITTKTHVKSFINTIEKNSGCTTSIKFFQNLGHKNFRNEILPEYKGHRTTAEAVALWKPTILEAFKEVGGVALNYIESDDAISVVANVLKPDEIVIISSDKDMIQVPGTHYNPFKSNIAWEERWQKITRAVAERFFWEQVLTGDPTDMPSSMCGIEKCGPKTAKKLISDIDLPILQIIGDAYTKKYGAKEGFIRANRTFKMVRLLKNRSNEYINAEAEAEVKMILQDFKSWVQPIEDDVLNLFQAPEPENLFKK